MTVPGGHNSSEQRPNMWEELNRPRRNGSRAETPPPPMQPPPPAAQPPPEAPAAPPPPPPMQPPPPAAQPATPPATSSLDHSTDFVDGEPAPDTPSAAAVAMKRVDSQHLLLVGGIMFIVVTFIALRGLGDTAGSSTTPEAASSATTVPELLPSQDEPTTVPVTTAPPSTEGPTAMGLPAELLDGPQSTVYRLYRTALGREPDRGGFQYWADQIRGGTPPRTLAREFLASDEFGRQFADGASPDERMGVLVENAFGPADDEQQLSAWIERYRGLEGAALLLAISEADETLAFTGTLR